MDKRRTEQKEPGRECARPVSDTVVSGQIPGGTPVRDGERDWEQGIRDLLRRLIRAADVDSRRLAAEHQITGPQMTCLEHVVGHGPLFATQIAAAVHLSPSTVAGILSRLEARGLVDRERDAVDRRLVHVRATDSGGKAVERTPMPLQFALDKAVRRLSTEQRKRIARSLQRLVDAMGDLQIAPPAPDCRDKLDGKADADVR